MLSVLITRNKNNLKSLRNTRKSWEVSEMSATLITTDDSLQSQQNSVETRSML